MNKYLKLIPTVQLRSWRFNAIFSTLHKISLICSCKFSFFGLFVCKRNTYDFMCQRRWVLAFFPFSPSGHLTKGQLSITIKYYKVLLIGVRCTYLFKSNHYIYWIMSLSLLPPWLNNCVRILIHRICRFKSFLKTALS